MLTDHWSTDTELYIQTFLASRPKPDQYDLSFFRSWLRGSKMGNFPLRGIDRKAWSGIYENDLIAIQRRETGDPLSTWFINRVVPKFHELIGHRLTVSAYSLYTSLQFLEFLMNRNRSQPPKLPTTPTPTSTRSFQPSSQYSPAFSLSPRSSFYISSPAPAHAWAS